MTCCDNRRAAWSREQWASSVSARTAEHKTSVFRYVGPGKLSVMGSASGKRYVFERTGAELEVAFEDSFALMSERYLRLKFSP
jgi:hypothetical protein